MPADLAEAVRSMPCRGCHADRGEYCPSAGTHLVRWELATVAGLIAEADYQAAVDAALPPPPGLPHALAVVPERSGVVCAAAGHPVRWAVQDDPPRWLHLDPAAGQSCPDGGSPVAAEGEPCRYLRRHWLLAIPAVAVAGTVPACRRCAARHARRNRMRWRNRKR
jgi:hypothetical protein